MTLICPVCGMDYHHAPGGLLHHDREFCASGFRALPSAVRRAIVQAVAKLAMAVEFVVNRTDDPHEWLYIRECVGHRLPKPVMWKVHRRGAVLAKDGEWEVEPQPSSRDDEFYARCRFDTFEEALEAARAAEPEGP